MTDERFNELYLYYASIGRTFDACSIWSIYEIPYLLKRAYCGRFNLNYSLHDVKSEPLPEDPTWYDIWVAAEYMIRKSGDMHHIFIESVRFVAPGELEFQTGS